MDGDSTAELYVSIHETECTQSLHKYPKDHSVYPKSTSISTIYRAYLKSVSIYET